MAIRPTSPAKLRAMQGNIAEATHRQKMQREERAVAEEQKRAAKMRAANGNDAEDSEPRDFGFGATVGEQNETLRYILRSAREWWSLLTEDYQDHLLAAYWNSAAKGEMTPKAFRLEMDKAKFSVLGFRNLPTNVGVTTRRWW
jgi:hypothetical protein